MKLLTDILDAISLLIQLLGSIIMFYNSPINQITGTQMGGNYNKSVPEIKNVKLKNGFKLLAIGITISIVSLLIKDFGIKA